MIPSLPTYAGWWKQPERVSRSSGTPRRCDFSHLQTSSACVLKPNFSRFSRSSTNSCRATRSLQKGFFFPPLTSVNPISGVLNRLRTSSGCACCSLRDIYYNHTQLFGSQTSVDVIVDDISCLLKVPRRALHVVGAPSRLPNGPISMRVDL